MGFSATVETCPGESAVVLAGELDLAAKAPLLDHVHRLLDSGERRVRIDLSGLTFCDSTGLGALIQAKRACAGAGGWLYITGTRGVVAEVLEITQLGQYLGTPPPAELDTPAG